MAKVGEKYQVLILTDENGLVYSEYDREVSHLSIYLEYKDLGVIVKDCYIQKGGDLDISRLLVNAVARYVEEVWDEPIDAMSLCIRKFRRNNQHIIMGISGKTEGGTNFYVSPSSIIAPEKNFFSEIG